MVSILKQFVAVSKLEALYCIYVFIGRMSQHIDRNLLSCAC